jgi:hypothetical protein
MSCMWRHAPSADHHYRDPVKIVEPSLLVCSALIMFFRAIYHLVVPQ